VAAAPVRSNRRFVFPRTPLEAALEAAETFCLVGDRPSRVRELCPCGGDDSFGSPVCSIRQIS
jgi:hypothetical protein